MNEVEWDHEELNATRINWLQQFEGTKFSQNGIIALDDVLLEKTGKHIDDVGIMYDHAQKRHILAHDLLFANYVDPKSGKHYPLDFRRFKKEDQCESEEVDFKKQTELFRELVGWCHENAIPGTFVFDSHYSSKEDLNYINSLKNDDGTSRAYVGDLMSNRIIVHKGVRQQISEFAKTIPPEDRKPMQITGANGKQRTQYFLTVCVKMGEACRELLRESIRSMVGWVMDELHIALDRVSSKRFEQLLARLGLVSLR